jgi:hypothetical protein
VILNYPPSPLVFNIVLEFLATGIRQKKEIPGIQIEKEEFKLSLFVDVIVLYLRTLNTPSENS